MEKKNKPVRSKCPSCQGIIELDRRYKLMELICCPHCRQVLEVVGVFPQVLDFPDDPYIPSSGKFGAPFN